MSNPQNIIIHEENDLKRLSELFFRNYKMFISSIFCTIGLVFLINRYSTTIYSISSSILVKENNQQGGRDVNDYLNSTLLGENKNLQNELWIIKSTPVLEETVRNLDLTVTYFSKGRIKFIDAYQNVPFKISYLQSHPQPINVRFNVSFLKDGRVLLTAKSRNTYFYNYETQQIIQQKGKWIFSKIIKIGELIETPALSFIVEYQDSIKNKINPSTIYGFEFVTNAYLSASLKKNLSISMADRLATVIKINLRCESQNRGIDIVNELMRVYSEQNLERKNHTASVTIEYIEKQLNEIADSLSLTEDSMQKFLSSNQLISISDRSTSISQQYLSLQNQLAELDARKKYYDYVIELLKNDNFSNLMLPASIGISDQLLNRLMTDLINAQAQRSALIENNQERNPAVQKYSIQIDNLKKTISDNIDAVAKTTNISIDEMIKRIRKIENEIKSMPATQRALGSIERKYSLNEAIYNYLMEKHAEAKITKASNLPDDVVIEPAMGTGIVSPNVRRNYLIAFLFGLAIPFGYLTLKMSLNTKIQTQDDIERITDRPVLGKILHNRYKTDNVIFEFPKSNIAESFRALRTNLDFYIRGGHKKVILITSCFENEGKSFVSRNLAMSYAQLGRKTILVDFDLRKPKQYFSNNDEFEVGLSSYMINKNGLEDIIIKSPHEKLDYIPAGILPPNPVELIALEKTEMLIAELKNDYDIVILDSTPLAQVTDSYLLVNLSEINVIVSRQNVTLKNVLSLIIKDLKQKNIDNICIVLNDNKYYRDQYGYGYGYYGKKGFFNMKKRGKKRKVGEFNSKLST